MEDLRQNREDREGSSVWVAPEPDQNLLRRSAHLVGHQGGDGASDLMVLQAFPERTEQQEQKPETEPERRFRSSFWFHCVGLKWIGIAMGTKPAGSELTWSVPEPQ